MDIASFTIYGERCTGTNFVRKLMFDNFKLVNVNLTADASGWKHFFGLPKNRDAIKNSADCVILSIVRNPIDYLMSFYNNPHHQPKERLKDFITFLTSKFYSVDPNGKEMMVDRNMNNTRVRYKDIFEMRSIKNRFLYLTIPTLTPNCYFMRYEDLKNNPKKIIGEIETKFNLVRLSSELVVEPKRVMPQGEAWFQFVLSNDPLKENYVIKESQAKDIIKNRLNFETEELIGYDKNTIIRRLV